MVTFRILNRSKSKTALLVHGLFTNSGYWLSYLANLKEFRLIILDIDFCAIQDVRSYVNRIMEIIEGQIEGTVDAVISHSLGALITSQFPPHRCRKVFEICPVYCATLIDTEAFVCEIQRKINFSMTGEEINTTLKNVDLAIASHVYRSSYAIKPVTYLPDADFYFTYQCQLNSKSFSGDHFEISEALADIRMEILG